MFDCTISLCSLLGPRPALDLGILGIVRQPSRCQPVGMALLFLWRIRSQLGPCLRPGLCFARRRALPRGDFRMPFLSLPSERGAAPLEISSNFALPNRGATVLWAAALPAPGPPALRFSRHSLAGHKSAQRQVCCRNIPPRVVAWYCIERVVPCVRMRRAQHQQPPPTTPKLRSKIPWGTHARPSRIPGTSETLEVARLSSLTWPRLHACDRASSHGAADPYSPGQNRSIVGAGRTGLASEALGRR